MPSTTPHRRVPGVQKIAVLRANALGDFLFALPALESLRSAYPRAEIVLLGDAWHAAFLPGRPGPVDRVLLAPPGPGLREAGDGEPGRDELTAAARAEGFDLALQLHGGGRNSNPVVLALGARVTAGLRTPDAPPLDRWLHYDYYQPEVVRYLEVAELVGAQPVTSDPRLPVTGRDLTEARTVVGSPRRPRVAIHPGATDMRRRWPAGRFAAVGDALADAGAELVVTGTGAERAVVEAVVSTMKHPARAVVDELSLGGLVGLYAGCALVVSNDTGPVHLAEAVGTATVGLYWASNLLVNGPVRRARHRALLSWRLDCPVCGVRNTPDVHPYRPRTGCEHREPFITDITVDEVREAALDLLRSRAA